MSLSPAPPPPPLEPAAPSSVASRSSARASGSRTRLTSSSSPSGTPSGSTSKSRTRARPTPAVDADTDTDSDSDSASLPSISNFPFNSEDDESGVFFGAHAPIERKIVASLSRSIPPSPASCSLSSLAGPRRSSLANRPSASGSLSRRGEAEFLRRKTLLCDADMDHSFAVANYSFGASTAGERSLEDDKSDPSTPNRSHTPSRSREDTPEEDMPSFNITHDMFLYLDAADKENVPESYYASDDDEPPAMPLADASVTLGFEAGQEDVATNIDMGGLTLLDLDDPDLGPLEDTSIAFDLADDSDSASDSDSEADELDSSEDEFVPPARSMLLDAPFMESTPVKTVPMAMAMPPPDVPRAAVSAESSPALPVPAEISTPIQAILETPLRVMLTPKTPMAGTPFKGTPRKATPVPTPLKGTPQVTSARQGTPRTPLVANMSYDSDLDSPIHARGTVAPVFTLSTHTAMSAIHLALQPSDYALPKSTSLSLSLPTLDSPPATTPRRLAPHLGPLPRTPAPPVTLGTSTTHRAAPPASGPKDEERARRRVAKAELRAREAAMAIRGQLDLIVTSGMAPLPAPGSVKKSKSASPAKLAPGAGSASEAVLSPAKVIPAVAPIHASTSKPFPAPTEAPVPNVMKPCPPSPSEIPTPATLPTPAARALDGKRTGIPIKKPSTSNTGIPRAALKPALKRPAPIPSLRRAKPEVLAPATLNAPSAAAPVRPELKRPLVPTIERSAIAVSVPAGGRGLGAPVRPVRELREREGPFGDSSFASPRVSHSSPRVGPSPRVGHGAAVAPSPLPLSRMAALTSIMHPSPRVAPSPRVGTSPHAARVAPSPRVGLGPPVRPKLAVMTPQRATTSTTAPAPTPRGLTPLKQPAFRPHASTSALPSTSSSTSAATSTSATLSLSGSLGPAQRTHSASTLGAPHGSAQKSAPVLRQPVPRHAMAVAFMPRLSEGREGLDREDAENEKENREDQREEIKEQEDKDREEEKEDDEVHAPVESREAKGKEVVELPPATEVQDAPAAATKEVAAAADKPAEPSAPPLPAPDSPTPAPRAARRSTRAPAPRAPAPAPKTPKPKAAATPSIAAGISERELRTATTRNTARNQVYLCAIDRQIVRVPGPRPPSPTSKIPKSADREEELQRAQREKRARKRRSDPDESSEDEMPAVEVVPFRLPGNEVSDRERPRKRVRVSRESSPDWEKAKDKEKGRPDDDDEDGDEGRVRWHSALTVIRGGIGESAGPAPAGPSSSAPSASASASSAATPDASAPAPTRSCLKRSAQIALDASGNARDRPVEKLKRAKVTVRAMFYDGEEPVEFSYGAAAQNTRSKKK